MATQDWSAWHAQYARATSPLARRLRIVQAHVGAWLDENPDRPVRVISACAGQGRDLLDVLAARADADRVHALLIELDERNVAAANEAARAAMLRHVEVRRADAGHLDAYVGATPADLLLFCGVFGNLADADVRRTITALPRLCAPGATVVWTRSRRDPDLTPSVRRWFALAGFAEVAFVAPRDVLFSVGVHRLSGEAQEAISGPRLFRFGVRRG